MALIDSVRANFAARFGGAPDGIWSAPGRANLIGEHTDYNGGFVLPFAIDRRTVIAVRSRPDDEFHVASSLFDAPIAAHLSQVGTDAVPRWASYVLGVAEILAHDHPGAVRGFDACIVSDVPLGAGLSSSAALECAVAIALNELWGLDLTPRALARAGQRTENTIVGAPTGIMDQSASMLGKADAAIFLDCRSEESQVVPLGFADAGLALLIVDTREAHSHATNGYADRRRACEAAAAALGVPLLRDLDIDSLERAEKLLDPVTFHRARHVITEDRRVLDTVQILLTEGPSRIGPLLTASHVSLRDDFEVTTERLNLVVDTALASGALGARMTGGGFGGCAIVLATADRIPSIKEDIRSAFAQHHFDGPGLFPAVPSDGARRDV